MDLEKNRKALDDREMELVSGGGKPGVQDKCPFCNSWNIRHTGEDIWRCKDCQRYFTSGGEEVI